MGGDGSAGGRALVVGYQLPPPPPPPPPPENPPPKPELPKTPEPLDEVGMVEAMVPVVVVVNAPIDWAK